MSPVQANGVKGIRSREEVIAQAKARAAAAALKQNQPQPAQPLEATETTPGKPAVPADDATQTEMDSGRRLRLEQIEHRLAAESQHRFAWDPENKLKENDDILLGLWAPNLDYDFSTCVDGLSARKELSTVASQPKTYLCDVDDLVEITVHTPHASIDTRMTHDA